MKNIVAATFTILAIGLYFTIHPVFAGDRVKVYEMAESGITIEFKMTAEEIAVEDAMYARLAMHNEANNKNPHKRVKLYEMGESKQFVSFPMTPEEIAAEDAENERLAAIRKTKTKEQKKQVVTYELAESGILVTFPVKTKDKAATETYAKNRNPEDSKI